MALDSLNRLCKWRMVLAGWIGGTRSMNQDGTRGLRDLQDKFLVARVESSAIAGLLIEKGVFTAEEFTRRVHHEAKLLDQVYENMFKGMRTTDAGIEIYDAALADETMKRLGFPP